MSSHRLRQVLGLGFGLAVIIGNTIGAGLLRTPGEVAGHLPNVWWFIAVWLLGGLYALLGAFAIAELGTMIPRSGGQYVFAQRALGAYAGFIVGWSDWISTCGTTSLVALVIGEYTQALFPGTSARIVAVTVTLAFAVLQWRGVNWGSSVQNLTSLLKAIAFVALIVACFAFGGNQPDAAAPPITSAQPFLISFVLALQAVIYTYDGWTGVIYFSEEVREPSRDVPRALFGGVLSIIAIYLLVNLAFLYVLPMAKLAGEPLAAAAAANVLFGAHGETVIRWLTIISLLSSINAYHLMASRVLFVSRDALFSRHATNVNAGGTPTVALLISVAVSLYFILSGTFHQVLAVLTFFFVANYTLSFVSVFVLRRTEPNAARPYRAWGFPFTTGLALFISIAFLFSAVLSDTKNSAYALVLLLASYPVFWLMRRFQRA
jgi:APA family basic amino acid/polyamine antiporter